MSAIDRIKDISNINRVNDWLDWIGEHDEACRAEVIAHCKADSSAMAYYVGRWETRSNLDKRSIPLTVPAHEPIITSKDLAAGETP